MPRTASMRREASTSIRVLGAGSIPAAAISRAQHRRAARIRAIPSMNRWSRLRPKAMRGAASAGDSPASPKARKAATAEAKPAPSIWAFDPPASCANRPEARNSEALG